jgi:mRNA interferase HigB
LNVEVIGEAAVAEFTKKHAQSRRPVARFLAVARMARWPHFPAIKQSFPAADYVPGTGTVTFDIGANKYRLAARIDFEEQLLFIQAVLTHEEYDRESF